MEIILINTFIAIIIAIFPYLVKYRKKYHLIAGYSDFEDFSENQILKNNFKKKANLICNCTFLFCILIIVLSILNYIFGVDEYLSNKLLKSFLGGIIIILSLFFSSIVYLIIKFSRK